TINSTELPVRGLGVNVRFWHKADMMIELRDVRFRGTRLVIFQSHTRTHSGGRGGQERRHFGGGQSAAGVNFFFCCRGAGGSPRKQSATAAHTHPCRDAVTLVPPGATPPPL